MQKFLRTITQNRKLIIQMSLGFLFLALGVFFIHEQRGELIHVRESLASAHIGWVALALVLVVVFVWVQGWMYVVSYAALRQKIGLYTAMTLYLKRNLISIFLPAGVITNLLFFNKSLERTEGVTKAQSYLASSIFSLCSIGSTVIIAIPALIWFMVDATVTGNWVWGVAITVVLLVGGIASAKNILNKGKLYQFIARKAPSFVETLSEIQSQTIDRKKVLHVLLLSVGIEGIGIAHLYISMLALGITPSFQIAFIGYSVVLLILMSSPFLRGIGVIEIALTYTLTLFGIPSTQALSIAFLFRFFEFWSFTILGVFAMVLQRDNVLIRILPAILIFLLGIVNIISGVTPALPERLSTLKAVIPLTAIHASVSLVIVSGIIMMGVSIYLLRGLRSAWIFAVVLSAVSLFAHLVKGIDWEEATIALLTLSALIYQRKQYFVRLDFTPARNTIFFAVVVINSAFLFGVIGFYQLDSKHFDVSFNLAESFDQTFRSLFLLDLEKEPVTIFGKEFILSLNIVGVLTWIYIAFIALRPLIRRPEVSDEEALQKAATIVQKYGNSSLDYFKVYNDKRIWFDPLIEGFVSFKVSRNYAVALENPVCETTEELEVLIQHFENYSQQSGLRTAYYRVPHSAICRYEKLNKKALPIGEEAIVNLTTWTMEGGDKKALRNAVNKLTKAGYRFRACEPPQKDGFLQQLEAVSELWLRQNKRTELAFSQGQFLKDELRNQTILSLESSEGRIEAFINLIPNKVPGQANFDLMRKTGDAPNGAMDFLFVSMFEYLITKGFTTCNLGMVPLSGITTPENFEQRIMKLAYERIKRFNQYRNLRDFKEKFNPSWEMMYLVYSSFYDLFYLPNALEKVNKS